MIQRYGTHHAIDVMPFPRELKSVDMQWRGCSEGVVGAAIIQLTGLP
jgi:hypothetical protein